MQIQEKHFRLKNGTEAVIRCPREEDIQSTLDWLYQTACETEFILRYPEECDKYTYEGEKRLFETWNASDSECALLCLVDGRVAAMCQVSFGKNIKTRHRGSVAITVLKEFWGLGMGTRLMEEIIAVAGSKEGVLQLELDFVEGNSRARALYEKMGFRISGVRPNGIRLKNGTMLNEYSMILTLKASDKERSS
ncbi:MAG: GNAT family N-acetyltransferase [Oscillospiraceae bacterium]|nr:GNAT family N-acetyltransferase [Oscillospiraceae bacterium]